jgi:hypothetical protein
LTTLPRLVIPLSQADNNARTAKLKSHERDKGKGTYHQKDALEAAGLLIARPRPDFIGNGRDKICWMTPPVIFLAQLAINPRRPPSPDISQPFWKESRKTL